MWQSEELSALLRFMGPCLEAFVNYNIVPEPLLTIDR